MSDRSPLLAAALSLLVICQYSPAKAPAAANQFVVPAPNLLMVVGHIVAARGMYTSSHQVYTTAIKSGATLEAAITEVLVEEEETHENLLGSVTVRARSKYDARWAVNVRDLQGKMVWNAPLKLLVVNCPIPTLQSVERRGDIRFEYSYTGIRDAIVWSEETERELENRIYRRMDTLARAEAQRNVASVGPYTKESIANFLLPVIRQFDIQARISFE